MYTELNIVESRGIKGIEGIRVDIVKIKKDGTKRIFFAPKYQGKRISSTLFSRKYDAVSLATKFIQHVANKK